MEANQMECVCFTVIVDDIVLPHGETVMEVLGGGGPQTLFGYQLVTNQSAAVGLSAGVGPDMPQRCQAWLESIGADTSGLVQHPRPTPRAWQVFEEWGRRTQIWRGRDDPCDQLYDMLRPKYDTMPPHFQRSSNYHLGVHPLHPPQRLLTRLREAAHANGGVLSVEPYTAAEEPASPEQAALLLSYCDIFSPNDAEAESIVGPGSPEELARRLLALSPPGGADVVVIRCGPQGVMAARRGRGPLLSRGGSQPPGASTAAEQVELEVEAYMVPAVADTRVIDVTGCGNAFCGGFLAALYRAGGGGGGNRGAGNRGGGLVGTAIGGYAAAAAGNRASELTSSPSPTAAAVRAVGANGSGASQSGGHDVRGGQGSGRLHGATPPACPAWLRTADLRLAGACGCVAASFMAEERGVPLTRLADLQERARQRLYALLPRVQPVDLAQAAGRRPAGKVVATLRSPESCTARRPGGRPRVQVAEALRLASLGRGAAMRSVVIALRV